jgi:dienelactone hydrolase
VTGSLSAETALLIVADIFGFYPQAIQGADILAHGDTGLGYQVFVPDLFDGKPADMAWYPPTNDEQRQALSNFFQTQGSPTKAVERIPEIVGEIQSLYPSVKSWGIVGFCWGGKVRAS